MRIARWTLLTASLAVATYAKDAQVKSPTECVAPTAAAALEAKIGDLQQSNAALQLQVDAHSADKTQLLADVAHEHESIVLKLQSEISALKSDVEMLDKNVKAQQQAADKAKAELKTALAKLNAQNQHVTERNADVSELEQQLASQRNAVAQSDAELQAALAKLHEEEAKTAQLEKSQRSAEHKHKALLKELSEAKSVELSMAALLSSYYDEAVDVAEQSAVYAQQKLSEQAGTLEQVQGKLHDVHKAARDSGAQFYSENLAATLDPILADVHRAVNPHVEKYLPIVQNEATKAKEQAVLYSQEALRRAKLARLEAIALLEQNEYVAAHAQKVIDGVLLVLAVPLVLFQARLALRLAWWLLSTALCVLTCGLCCGSRKRSSKTKRKNAKKTASVNSSLNAPLNGPTAKTSSSKTTSTSQKKRSKKVKN